MFIVKLSQQQINVVFVEESAARQIQSSQCSVVQCVVQCSVTDVVLVQTSRGSSQEAAVCGGWTQAAWDSATRIITMNT